MPGRDCGVCSFGVHAGCCLGRSCYWCLHCSDKAHSPQVMSIGSKMDMAVVQLCVSCCRRVEADDDESRVIKRAQRAADRFGDAFDPGR